MSETKVKQEEITAGKNVSGRDTYDYTFVNHPPVRSISYIESLTKKFKTEKDNNTAISDIIEELQHYKSQIDGENFQVQGLEKKLANGGFENIIPKAIEYKEKFSKKLVKHENSESAQEIFAYLLAEVKTNFDLHVYPLILRSVPINQINQTISDFVITPVQNELGENILRIYKDDINGMIFYLTGNCHIKWV